MAASSRPWLRTDAAGAIVLALHVQPNAARTELVGRHGDALKVKLAAPPADGKANACLVEFLSGLLEVTRADVKLLGGATSRRKLVRVSAVAPSALEKLRRLAG